MLEPMEMVRTHRSMMQAINDVDSEPTTHIEISPELRAIALADYCEICRSSPESEWQDFSEFLLTWLDARLYDESITEAEEEIADELTAMRAVEMARQRELPFDPYSDEDDYPF